MKDERLEQRLEEWARWCLEGRAVSGLGYPSNAPGCSEFVKKELSPVITHSREQFIERIVTEIAKDFPVRAECLRAEYRAHEKFGNANFESTGNDCKKTHRQIGVSADTYRKHLREAKFIIQLLLKNEQRRFSA